MTTNESVFEKISRDRYLLESEFFFVIDDGFPVSPGHKLIVSKSKKRDFFSLSQPERQELIELIEQVKNLAETSNQPDGYNIGMNCGEAAGQTVMHFHCHVIPRYRGDMAEPAGGIRHCVSGKGNYTA